MVLAWWNQKSRGVPTKILCSLKQKIAWTLSSNVCIFMAQVHRWPMDAKKPCVNMPSSSVHEMQYQLTSSSTVLGPGCWKVSKMHLPNIITSSSHTCVYLIHMLHVHHFQRILWRHKCGVFKTSFFCLPVLFCVNVEDGGTRSVLCQCCELCSHPHYKLTFKPSWMMTLRKIKGVLTPNICFF